MVDNSTKKRTEEPLKSVLVNTSNNQIAVNEKYKDTIFRKLFHQKKKLLDVDRIRYYKGEMNLPLQQAVEKAVDECIKEGILADFLSKDRSEAIMFSIYEHNEEEEWRKFREAERELGREEERDHLLHNLMQNANITETEAKKALGII